MKLEQLLEDRTDRIIANNFEPGADMPRRWARKVLQVADNLKGSSDPDAFILIPDDQKQKATYDLNELFEPTDENYGNQLRWLFYHKDNTWEIILEYRDFDKEVTTADNPNRAWLKGKKSGLYIFIRTV